MTTRIEHNVNFQSLAESPIEIYVGLSWLDWLPDVTRNSFKTLRAFFIKLVGENELTTAVVLTIGLRDESVLIVEGRIISGIVNPRPFQMSWTAYIFNKLMASFDPLRPIEQSGIQRQVARLSGRLRPLLTGKSSAEVDCG